MTYAEILSADRRLSVLLLLDVSPGGSANEALLQAALVEYGHEAPADQVRTDLAWLAEQGLLGCREVQGLQVAALTVRGADVAHGRAVVPGVKRPRPGG